jgi:hypothetical protein
MNLAAQYAALAPLAPAVSEFIYIFFKKKGLTLNLVSSTFAPSVFHIATTITTTITTTTTTATTITITTTTTTTSSTTASCTSAIQPKLACSLSWKNGCSVS